MRADPPAIRLEPAPRLTLTGQVDCASPAFWDGGALRVFTSAQHPSVAHGLALETLGPAAPVRLRGADMRWWIEAVHHGPACPRRAAAPVPPAPASPAPGHARPTDAAPR